MFLFIFQKIGGRNLQCVHRNYTSLTPADHTRFAKVRNEIAESSPDASFANKHDIGEITYAPIVCYGIFTFEWYPHDSGYLEEIKFFV